MIEIAVVLVAALDEVDKPSEPNRASLPRFSDAR